MRILIADDEAIIRMGLRSILQEAGHEVVASVTNGAAALDFTVLHKPDLVILDIKMPDQDGLTTAHKIMQERPTPIIMLTAYSQPDLVKQANAASVFAYLVKPVKEETLIATLELARKRFKEWEKIRKEASDLEASLAARDLVERAKVRLMKEQGISEKEAYIKIQKRARVKRMPMDRIAQEIMRKRQVGS
jgi:response regulator NasT